MRLILFLVILLFAVSAYAKEEAYILDWDANTETDLAGYKVYQRYKSQAEYSKIPIAVVTKPTYTGVAYEDEDKIVTICFAVTAFNAAGLESGYSNEVELIIDNRTIQKAPKNPVNLKIRKPNL